MTRTDDQLALDREIQLRLFYDDCGEAAATVRGDSVYRRLPESWSTDRNLTPRLFAEIERREMYMQCAQALSLILGGDKKFLTWWEILTATPGQVCQAALAVCRADENKPVYEGLSPESVAKLKEGAEEH